MSCSGNFELIAGIRWKESKQLVGKAANFLPVDPVTTAQNFMTVSLWQGQHEKLLNVAKVILSATCFSTLLKKIFQKCSTGLGLDVFCNRELMIQAWIIMKAIQRAQRPRFRIACSKYDPADPGLVQ